MKKVFPIIMAFLFSFIFTSFSLAQPPVTEPPAEMMNEGMAMKMSEGDHEDKMGHHWKEGKCPMCGKMKSKMQKSMVATSDGGVVVLSHNKLTKYDKNLNIVKEVELKSSDDKVKMFCPLNGKDDEAEHEHQK